MKSVLLTTHRGRIGSNFNAVYGFYKQSWPYGDRSFVSSLKLRGKFQTFKKDSRSVA